MLDGCYLALLLVVAVFILFFAIKKKDLLAWVLPLVFSLLVVLLYGQWGGWFSWQQYQQQQAKKKQLQAILTQFKTPQSLIHKLETTLKQAPNHAHGWYLLGKLYANQGDWKKAHEVFQKAIQLAPSDERYSTNDIYAQWMMNQRHFNADIRTNLKALLKKNPKQPDALALLAMDAYQQKHYQQAITTWQVLLTLAPSESEAAGALRKAIAQAQREWHLL